MSRIPSGTSAAPIDVISASRQELFGLLDDVTVAINERPHLIRNRIAGSLGLRYDQVRGTQS